MFENINYSFDATHERDGQTDRQTDRRTPDDSINTHAIALVRDTR